MNRIYQMMYKSFEVHCHYASFNISLKTGRKQVQKFLLTIFFNCWRYCKYLKPFNSNQEVSEIIQQVQENISSYVKLFCCRKTCQRQKGRCLSSFLPPQSFCMLDGVMHRILVILLFLVANSKHYFKDNNDCVLINRRFIFVFVLIKQSP